MIWFQALGFLLTPVYLICFSRGSGSELAVEAGLIDKGKKYPWGLPMSMLKQFAKTGPEKYRKPFQRIVKFRRCTWMLLPAIFLLPMFPGFLSNYG